MECHADFTKKMIGRISKRQLFFVSVGFVLKSRGRTLITEKAKEVLSGSLPAVAHKALPVPVQPKAFQDL